MAERPVRSYPPEGDPARLDAIMRRGRSMRRRRQLGVGAGAGGAVLAAVFGVVLLVGAADQGDDVIADDTAATTTSTTSTTAPLPETMVVEIDVDSATVVVIDPEQPGVDDAEQCLSVWVTDSAGMDVAQGYACNGATGDADATLELEPVDPMLGQTTTCAKTEDRALPDTPPPPDPRPATSDFGLQLPDLGPGTYTLDAQATSGSGDGCPGSSDGSDEIEHEASASPTELVVQ